MMNKKMPIENKSKVLNKCIISAMVYGCETWALTKEVLKKMRITIRKTERIMLGVYLKDRKKNTWIRQKNRSDRHRRENMDPEVELGRASV
jgi:hypothetical protein